MFSLCLLCTCLLATHVASTLGVQPLFTCTSLLATHVASTLGVQPLFTCTSLLATHVASTLGVQPLFTMYLFAGYTCSIHSWCSGFVYYAPVCLTIFNLKSLIKEKGKKNPGGETSPLSIPLKDEQVQRSIGCLIQH